MQTKIWRSTYCLSIIILASMAVSGATKVEPTATITVGQFPSGVAYDSAKKEIFVSNLGDGTVSVISDATMSVIKTINVGKYPRGLAYDPAKGELFVSNSGDGTVSVLSDETNTVVATVKVGDNPFGPVYDPAKGEIYVPNFNSHSVSVISDATNEVIDRDLRCNSQCGKGLCDIRQDKYRN